MSDKNFGYETYYMKNKTRINNYNRKYWHTYYQINKLKLKLPAIHKQNKEHEVIIKQNVRVTF